MIYVERTTMYIVIVNDEFKPTVREKNEKRKKTAYK